jgi:hypothetical protein
MQARGRLKNFNKLLATRSWDVLPQGRRGQRMLKWAAHHAWRAADRNPERSVRNLCRKRAPYLKPAEVDQLVAYTADRATTWWTHDDSARVLDVGVCEREANELWFLGACDDPDYEIRGMIKNAKAMMRGRRRRAAKGTGSKGGRSRLELSPDEMAARKAQDAARKRDERAAERSGRPRGRPKSDGIPAWQAAGFSSERSYYRHKARGSENASRETSSRSYSNNRQRDGVFADGISLPPVSTAEACDRRPPEAARRQTPQPLVIRLDEAPTGKFIDQDGNEFEILQPHETRDWQTIAMAGMNRRLQ